MLSDDLLKILRCPQSGEPLALVDEPLLARLNEMVESGKLRNRAGETVSQTLDAGLVAEQGQLVYPVFDDIPDLVSGDAIPLEQLPPTE